MIAIGTGFGIVGPARCAATMRILVAARIAAAAIVLGAGAAAMLPSVLEAQEEPAPAPQTLTYRAGEQASKRADERPEILAQVLRTDPSPSLRRNAAWGLARFSGSALASQALGEALEHDASADVRETSAWALGQIHSTTPSTTHALDKALGSDKSEAVRATAAWALGTLRANDSSEALEAALQDPDASVRKRAIWALGHARYRSAPAGLAACLGDADPEVRSLAAWSLMSIGDRNTISALTSAFRTETDPRIRSEDMHALTSMGDASLDAIRSILESPDKIVQAKGVDALANGRASGPWPWPWPDPRPFP